ncbi:MAG: uracil phosphoribosyltransferase [Armatimonadetes bacterium]|nr:uracil phosphoribosyltransferase [Armatimonadota bacterium]
MNVTVLQHPLAAHFLTHLRDRTTKPALFRLLCKRLTVLLAVEASAHLALRPRIIETPLEPFEGRVLDEPLVAVPVLRAGLGMLDPLVEFFPDVSVGYIGLERDEATAVASSYYAKLPRMSGRTTLVLDPMLATGGSADQAIATVKAAGAGQVLMLSIVAAPEGVTRVNAAHPDVPIFTAGLDRGLNDRKYILPGLGDFGDRLYGTEST